MRRFTSGFEWNSTSVHDWSSTTGGVVISSSIARSGSFSTRMDGMVSATRKGWRYSFAASTETGHYFYRTYLRVDTLPSAENRIMGMGDAASFPGATNRIYITIDSAGLLRLYDEDGVIGSPSSAISTGDFNYRIEIEVNCSGGGGSHVVKARVNGTEFASSSTRNISTGLMSIGLGANLNAEGQTIGDWYFDDVALNDSTGSFQNTYPGTGKVVMLLPNAPGDNIGWTGDWSALDDNPSNTSDFLTSNTLGQIEDVSMSNPKLNSTDTVNVIHACVRYNGAGASANAGFKLRLKTQGGGSVETSTEITPVNTTWVFNANAIPQGPPITIYDQAGASTSLLTAFDVDALQLGVELATVGSSAAQITSLYAIVEYVPGIGISANLMSSFMEAA